MGFDLMDISRKDFISMLNRYVKEGRYSIGELLSLTSLRNYNHGHYEHENKTAEELKQGYKHANSKFTIGHINVNVILADGLWMKRNEIADFLFNNYCDKTRITTKYPCPIGLGYVKNQNNMLISNSMSIILIKTPYKEPGFHIKTYYPDVLRDGQKVDNNYGYIDVSDIIREYKLKQDDIDHIFGMDHLSFKQGELTLIHIPNFLEYLLETETLEYLIESKQTTEQKVDEFVRNIVCDGDLEK